MTAAARSTASMASNALLTAVWTSEVSDNSTFEQWNSEGEKNQMDRAAKIAQKLLDSYSAPEISSDTDEELRAFIDKKMSDLPDAEY